jgi:hypothetical protein
LEELNKELPPFALSRGAVKAIDLLDKEVYFTPFKSTLIPLDDVLLIYRVLFLLVISNKDIALTQDKEEFWRKVSKYFIENIEGRTRSINENLMKTVDFTNQTILTASKIVTPHLSKISPNYYSKLCPTTGIVIFLVKDALEYAGIIQEKKTPPARINRNLMYIFETLQEKVEKLKNIQNKFFSI